MPLFESLTYYYPNLCEVSDKEKLKKEIEPLKDEFYNSENFVNSVDSSINVTYIFQKDTILKG